LSQCNGVKGARVEKSGALKNVEVSHMSLEVTHGYKMSALSTPQFVGYLLRTINAYLGMKSGYWTNPDDQNSGSVA
jgi:hypothetical protein